MKNKSFLLRIYKLIKSKENQELYQSLKDDGTIGFNFIRFHKLLFIIPLGAIKEFNKKKYHIIFTLLFHQIGLNIINNKKCKLDINNSGETIYCYYSQLITTFKFYDLAFDTTISIVILILSTILVVTILSILKIEQNEENNYEDPVIDTTKENTTDITKEPLIFDLNLIKSMIIVNFLTIIYTLIIVILWIGVPLGIYVTIGYIIDKII